MNNNKLQEAKGHFTRICNDNPKDAEAWYQLSTINGRLGDIAAAGECCQRVLDIQPAHYDAQVNFGNVLYIQGKIVEATNQYQRAIKINPGNPSAYINLGNILV